MSELQDAIRKYDKTGSAYGNVKLFVEAARLVADPNIEAARDSVDLAGVVLRLRLWRIMELAGMPVGDVVEKDLTGFAMMIRDSIVNKELVAVALTPGEDDVSDISTGISALEIGVIDDKVVVIKDALTPGDTIREA